MDACNGHCLQGAGIGIFVASSGNCLWAQALKQPGNI